MKQNEEELRKDCVQYAIELITGKGLHSGRKWLEDAFNDYCEATGANKGMTIARYDEAEVEKYLDEAPWMREIAEKPLSERNFGDFRRVVEDFIAPHWLLKPEEVTTRDVSEILNYAGGGRRQLVAQQIAIDCIHALDNGQLEKLDAVLADIAYHPQRYAKEQLKY